MRIVNLAEQKGLEGKRRRRDPEFKACVVLEAIKGVKTKMWARGAFSRKDLPVGCRAGLANKMANKEVQTTGSVRDRVWLIYKGHLRCH